MPPTLNEPLSLEIFEQIKSKAGAPFDNTHSARRTDRRLYLRSAYSSYLSQEQRFKIYLVSGGYSEDFEFGNP